MRRANAVHTACGLTFAVGLSLSLLAPAAAIAAEPPRLQDSARLTWLVPGFLPEQGLLTFGVRGSRYHPGYNPTGAPAHYDVLQATAFAEWSPLSRLALSLSQDWRSWSNHQAPGQAESGSGLADGALRLAVAAPGLPRWLGLVVWGGRNLATGTGGLSEDAVSPEAGATLTLRVWRESQLPELRLHLSAGRRWNGNDARGYGAGLEMQPQPWFPLYPSAADAGGDDRNDFALRGVAIEFRQAAASLWLEYSELRLDRALNVSRREDQQTLAAGLRWGLQEGWALAADFQVGFWRDDLATPWYPRLPHQGYTLAISRQLALGWPR